MAIPILAVVLALTIIQPWSVNPQNVLAKAYEAATAVQSYHMILSGSGSSTPDGITSKQYMEIEFAAPDRYHVVSTENLNGTSDRTLEFIAIGDDWYSRGGNGSYIAMASTIGMPTIFDKEATLYYLDMLTDIKTMPDEMVGGVDCLHYAGKWDVEKQIAETEKNFRESFSQGPNADIPEEEIEKIIADMREGMRLMQIDLELWIGKNDYMIRRMAMNQQVPDGPDGNGTSTFQMNIEFTSINEPIAIEPPLDENGNLLPGWTMADTYSPPPQPEKQYFSFNMIHTIGSQEGHDDPEHQEVEYSISITNQSTETVNIIRLFIINEIITEDNNTLEVELETMGLPLTPGQSHTFHARQPFDTSVYTKEEIMEMDDETLVLVDFITEDGQKRTQLIYPDATYPSKVPPSATPEE